MIAMKKLSSAITEQVKKMPPEIRKEVKEELKKWDTYKLGEEFYSDEVLIKTIPYSTYEYVLLAKRIRVDKSTVINWLNSGLFNEDMLEKVIAHALRRLILKH
ncbi:MAG: hypothetical protein KGJ07_07135 [Patescibacteria group bacterium]|nr:hypothetical protein [Patescibacteria group bacterium]